MADEKFMGLPKRLELAVGAPVLLLHNLAVEHGLVNGSQGIVRDIIYEADHNPNHARVACRMPSSIIVDFPKYTGPAFLDDAPSTWVPLMPRTRETGDDDGSSRTMYPLTLAWALTPWKAQGMTLDKVKVHINNAAASPGVLFTALTRIQHPDQLLLDDAFPSYDQIMRGRRHKSFTLRQHWERQARATFSRTIRRHMREPGEYSETHLWTEEDSILADELINFYGSHPDSTLDSLCEDILPKNSANSPEAVARNCKRLSPYPNIFNPSSNETNDAEATIQRIWTRLQSFPYIFELAERRNTLSSLNLDGTTRDQPAESPNINELDHSGFTVKLFECYNYVETGQLSTSLTELLAHSLRKHFNDSTTAFLKDYMLTKRKLSPLMRWKPYGRELPLPDETFMPYYARSKHWGLYVLRRCSEDHFRLDCFLPTKAQPEAFESTTRYIASTFRVGTNLHTHPAPDEGLKDAALFWYFYAAFLKKTFDRDTGDGKDVPPQVATAPERRSPSHPATRRREPPCIV